MSPPPFSCCRTDACDRLAALDNPSAVFDDGTAPAVASQLVLLDLGGDGLRALSWIPALDGYLLIGGRQMLVIVSDDGSRKEDRPARFLLLDAAQIRLR